MLATSRIMAHPRGPSKSLVALDTMDLASLIMTHAVRLCSLAEDLQQCVRKKRDQNVFGNISDKTRAILMKFDVLFPE